VSPVQLDTPHKCPGNRRKACDPGHIGAVMAVTLFTLRPIIK
jgi:hypothetical protein